MSTGSCLAAVDAQSKLSTINYHIMIVFFNFFNNCYYYNDNNYYYEGRYKTA